MGTVAIMLNWRVKLQKHINATAKDVLILVIFSDQIHFSAVKRSRHTFLIKLTKPSNKWGKKNRIKKPCKNLKWRWPFLKINSLNLNYVGVKNMISEYRRSQSSGSQLVLHQDPLSSKKYQAITQRRVWKNVLACITVALRLKPNILNTTYEKTK